jgi:signal peptidase I
MGKTFRVVLWTAIVIGAIVGFARAIAIRWWRIPEDDVYLTASLTPSLRGGDLIVLWRLTKPAYGDLVLCPDPEHPERVVIGRLIGEEGNHVVIDTGRVSIDDKKLAIESNCTERQFKVADPQTGIDNDMSCDMEVAGGKTHMRGYSNKNVSPTVDVTVPQGKVYLISDNRLFPYDSRDYGPVDRDSCKETVLFRLVGLEGYGDSNTRFTFIR